NADPGRIDLKLSGADSLRLTRRGDLSARVDGRTLTQLHPVAYQPTATGRQRVAARFVLEGDRVSFRIGSYDRSRPLVIDPILSYSDYFGGTSAEAIYD